MKFLERSLDGKNQFWRYIITFAGYFLASNIIGVIPIVAVFIFQYAKSGGSVYISQDLTTMGISQNLALALMLFATVVGLFATILFIRWLHKRTFAETVNGTNKVKWNKVLFGGYIWFIILAVYYAIYLIIDPANFVVQLDIWKFIPLVFISIILIPFQTTSEELLFRGYLAQGVAGWTKSRWWAIIVPAVLFGLLHSFNPEVEAYGFLIAMPQYILFGLIFGLIAVLDDGIELSMGVHAVNNIFLSLFITNESSVLQTPAVFNQQFINMGLETIVLLASGIIAIIIFAKRYKWNFSVLNKKVVVNQIEQTSNNYNQENLL